MIDPGEMDQQITIQRKTVTPSRTGGRAVSWQTLAVCFAKVRSKPGGERMEDGRMNATTMNAFTIWLDAAPTVSEDDRILWNGETWNIRGIFRSGSRVLTLQIDAERGVGAAA